MDTTRLAVFFNPGTRVIQWTSAAPEALADEAATKDRWHGQYDVVFIDVPVPV